MKNKYVLLIILILGWIIPDLAYGDGGINVSPSSGSMKYTYPISNNSIDGHSFRVNLNYASNVMITNFNNYCSNSTVDGWNQLTKLEPLWILGVNGFAIQVFHYKFKPFNWVVDQTDDGPVEFPDPFEDGSFYRNEYQLNWLINGYDFCNRMQQLTADGDQDIIRILKSDGSLLELRNAMQRSDVQSDGDSSLFVGDYYVNGINTDGYAKVSFSDKYWPSYISKFADSTGNAIFSYKPRVIRYFPGNGLEYVFYENVAPYGTRAFKYLYK